VSPARPVNPEDWPRPSGYSNATSAEGRIVCIAGQVGSDPATGAVTSFDFADQARRSLLNVRTALAAAGAAPADVVRLTWYVTDGQAYTGARARIGEAYREVFGRHYPAMSVVVVAGLLEPGAKVEIEATAVVPPHSHPSPSGTQPGG